MKVDVRFVGLDASESLRDYTVRLVERKLNRLASYVHSVSVRIHDINGPRGGLDKQCSVTLRGRSFEPLSVRSIDSDAYAAVGAATHRLAHTLRRRVDERQTRRLSA